MPALSGLGASVAQAHGFRAFGPSHWAVLGTTAAGAGALIGWLRQTVPPEQVRRRECAVRRALAGTLIIEEVAALGLAAQSGVDAFRFNLPLQLCDWAVFVAIVALLTRCQLAFELAYFWGLSGTVQALLTPDLTADFPSPAFLTFMSLHATTVVSVLVLSAGLGRRPRRSGAWRAWCWLQVYALVAGAADFLLDSNYGYLRKKPDHPSLLDAMGKWPYYILGMEALALVLFGLLALPFAKERRLKPSSECG
jgi:hypothetical integral membrane protein (TIGR02206 family)